MRQVPIYTIGERRPKEGDEILLLLHSEFYNSVDVRWGTIEYSWEPDDEDCGTSFVYEGQKSVPGYHLVVVCEHTILDPKQEYMVPDEVFNAMEDT